MWVYQNIFTWKGSLYWNCYMTSHLPAMSHKSWCKRCKSPWLGRNCNITAVDTRILLIHWRALLWEKPINTNWSSTIGRRLIRTTMTLLDQPPMHLYCVWEIFPDDSSRALFYRSLEHMHAIFTSPKATILSTNLIEKKRPSLKINFINCIACS